MAMEWAWAWGRKLSLITAMEDMAAQLLSYKMVDVHILSYSFWTERGNNHQ